MYSHTHEIFCDVEFNNKGKKRKKILNLFVNFTEQKLNMSERFSFCFSAVFLLTSGQRDVTVGAAVVCT